MIVFLYDSNGQFLRELQGEPVDILGQIPIDHQVTPLRPPRLTDYFNGTDWVDIGPAPNWYFKFDYAEKRWVDSRDLEQTRAAKWEAIKLERNQLEFAGFSFDGNVYDSDMFSQIRISGAVQAGQSTVWTLQNNESVTLTVDKLEGLGQALIQHVNAAHNRSRIARKNLNECTTLDQIDAIKF